MIGKAILRAQKALSTSVIANGLSSLTEWRAAGLLFAGLFLACGSAAFAGSSVAPAAKHLAENYGRNPLSFEANQGQSDASVQFLSRGSGYSLFLTKNEVVLNLERKQAATPAQGDEPGAAHIDTLRMKLVGANASAAVSGLEPQSSTVNYLIGNDSTKWRTGVHTFGKVGYAQVYPGVDLVFYGNQRQLEYDFVVAAGADPSRIAWQIDGAKPTIDADGNLVLSAADGPAGFKKPVLYQMDGDKKIAVEGAFTLAGNRIGFRLGSYDHAKPLIIDPVLTYATYLGGSTDDYLGGTQSIGIEGLNGAGNVDQGIAFDSQGSAYVVGTTDSTDFPVQSPYQSNPYGTKVQGFGESNNPTTTITKFSPDGTSLVYSTYLGGSYQDYGEAIAVDSNGEAFVVGQTHSPDFPITSGAYQSICSPNDNGYDSNKEDPSCGSSANGSAFVTKLNADGSGLVYSTYFGGDGTDSADSIAVDSAGRAYVGGMTYWIGCHDVNGATGEITYPYTCFPTTSGAVISGSDPDDGAAESQGFIAVFDPTGADLLYSSLFSSRNPGCMSWISSQNTDCSNQLTGVNGVAVDASGNFYIVGETSSMFLPTTAGVIQPTTGPAQSNNPRALQGQRGFVAKFNPVTATGGASLAYSTYLGGLIAGGEDMVSNIITDAEGNSYVTGITSSTDFPVTSGAYQTSAKLSSTTSAAFAAKLNPTGTAIEWATYLGSATGNQDGVSAVGPIQLDGSGNVYVTVQAGGNYPSIGTLENTWLGTPVFVSELDPTGSKLLFSAGLGPGNGGTMIAGGLAVDPAGNMYVAMTNPCAGAVVTSGSFQQTNHNTTGCAEFSSTGYVAKIAPLGTATVSLAAAPSPAALEQSVTLTATVTPTATYAFAPTGTIIFKEGTGKLATVALNSSGVATYTSSTFTLGTLNFSAVYSGDATYPAGSGATTLIMSKDAQTITFPAITGTQYALTQITLAATASSGLAVTLTSVTPAVCTLSGTTASLLQQGTCIVQARQVGSSLYAGAPMVQQSIVVHLAPQTITFPVPAGTQYALTPVPLTATASSGLPITYTSITPTYCTVTGSTAYPLQQGSCFVHASQAGNNVYSVSPLVTQYFAIHLAPQTITFPAITATEYVLSQLTLSATASSGLTVSFASATPAVCTVSGTTASLLTPGDCVIHATQAGNKTVYAVAALVSQSFIVHANPQTITFPAISATLTAATTLPLTATASSGLTVSFASTTPAVCTVSGTTANLLTSGICIVQATQAGNANYAAAALVQQNLVVHLAAQTITFPAVAAQVVGANATLGATASSGLTVSYTSVTNSVCTVSGSTATMVSAGACVIHATQAGNATYAAAPLLSKLIVVTAK